MEGIFTFVLFEKTENFLQQKRDCILEEMNIDMENHVNDYLIPCGSTIIVKASLFA